MINALALQNFGDKMSPIFNGKTPKLGHLKQTDDILGTPEYENRSYLFS